MKNAPLLLTLILTATSLAVRAEVLMSDDFNPITGNRTGSPAQWGQPLGGGTVTGNNTRVQFGTGYTANGTAAPLTWQNRYTTACGTVTAMNGFVYSHNTLGDGNFIAPDPTKTSANNYVAFPFLIGDATHFNKIITVSVEINTGLDSGSTTNSRWTLGFWETINKPDLAGIVSNDAVTLEFYPYELAHSVVTAGGLSHPLTLKIRGWVNGASFQKVVTGLSKPSPGQMIPPQKIRLTLSYDMNTGEIVATANDITDPIGEPYFLMSATLIKPEMSDLNFVGFGMTGLVTGLSDPTTVDNFQISADHKTAELISDRTFKTGFSAYNPCLDVQKTNTVDGILQYTGHAGPPIWTLAQWSSHASIAGTPPTVLTTGAYQWNGASTTLAPGAYEWRDAYKSIAFGPASATDVVLSVDSEAEYGGEFRAGGNLPYGPDWPHLIIGQRVSNPNGQFGENSPSLDELKALIMHVELKLLQAKNNHDNDIYGTPYDQDKHMSIFYIGIPVQNLNITSPDYGKVISFGIMVYNDRANFSNSLNGNLFYRSFEGIYQIGMPFTTSLLQLNQWKTLHGDILPYILDAFDYAKSVGAVAADAQRSDFKVGNLGLSWEVSGLSKVSIHARNYSLKAIGPAFPPAYDFNSTGNKEGWTSYNITDNSTSGGKWNFVTLSSGGNDPQLVSPDMRVDADEFKQVRIRMMNLNPAPNQQAELFWKRTTNNATDTTFSSTRHITRPISSDGSYAEIIFDMTGAPNWDGEINQIRIDPVIQSSGQPIAIDYIHFD